MSVEIVFGVNLASDKQETVTEDDISRMNPALTHTGKGDLTATLAGNRSLEEFAKRQDRINVNINGSTKWTGYLTDVSHDKARGSTRIKADGIGKRLEETRPDYDSIGGPVTYNNIALQDALRDYWGRTPFSNFSVTDQTTELIAENETIQTVDTTTEWQDSTSIPNTDAAYIDSGSIHLSQSLFLRDAGDSGDYYDFNIGSPDNDSEAVDGVINTFSDSSHYLELTPFELKHTIEESNVRLALRWKAPNDVVDLRVSIIDHSDGSTVGSVETEPTLASFDFFEWNDSGSTLLDEWTDGDLTPGEYRLRIDALEDGTDGSVVDQVTAYDARFSYNFDNTVDSNNQLDGPELFPEEYIIETDVLTTSYNIVGASISSTWDDTSGNQSIGVSNDGGSNYQRSSNTDTIDVSFSDPGREARIEYTLSRYGSRTDATPKNGYLGQDIDSYTLSVDGDDLVVIDSLELSRNNFDNLSTLHSYGDFLWVIEHDSSDIGNLVVSSFQRGDETRPAPDGFDDPKNQQPEIQSGTYYNSIYLEGAKRDDGTRPSAEVKDQDEINNAREEISPGVLRDYNVTTEAGAAYRARALLEAALSNNDLVGSVTVPATVADPGYAREIDLGDGLQYKTVEEVSLSLGTDTAEATFDFSVRSGFSEDITELRRNARNVGDQV